MAFALGAHSDDLAFSLGGAFRDGRLAGCRPITIFSRSAYTPECPAGDPAAVSALRKGEDVRFFAATAAGEPLWLDHPDAPLRSVTPEQVFRAPLRRGDVDALVDALRSLVPRGCLLLAPLALGAHLDHRLVSGAACLLHGEECRRVLFYEDLPYAAFMEPAAIEAAVRQVSRRLGAALRPHWWVSPELAEAKQWAVASYASQADGHLLDHLLRHARRVAQGGVAAERVWVPAGDESGIPE